MSSFINLKKYLSIGDFSKLSGISRKNLIYYDDIGLLKPALVKENGYRYYSYSQLDLVSIILFLKDLDVPLKDIKSYIENISHYNLIQLISHQRDKIFEELNRLNQMNYIIEQRTKNIAMMSNVNYNDVFLENCEEEALFLSPDFTFSTSDIDLEEDFGNFLDYCYSKKILYGYPVGVCGKYSDVLSGKPHLYNYFYKLSPNMKSIERTFKPSGLYVTTYDNSYLAEDFKVFQRIDDYIQKNNISVYGAVYIENISDEMITKSPNKYLSKISVQVTKGANT
ncbi:MerR family transcriptional regulator [Clostridium sp. SHJSY1]|uniref:MerR family transcriptional regulator n=1 Tax=Clostridium sp. SHJSY1 TaxID=2942483 RepID=UPI002874033A|nr:MerR family transcriptional regulator [Clostridium sp. SHJSY1]MDS0526306.1 MerR family transcriptional regulator [Clostridium sp. SHJSY1]